ncbi:MAG: hypothetical protein V2J10_02370 [Wenzhouxiangella sp.]|nr:hypothetical protein [Wenzhouxiangella sp.]
MSVQPTTSRHRRSLRILLLLLILTPLVYAYQAEPVVAPDWQEPLIIAIYPAAAGIDAAQLDALPDDRYRSVERFLNEQARGFGLTVDRAIEIRTGRPIERPPGLPPRNGSGTDRLLWALGLRWWYWHLDSQELDPDVIVITRYGPVTEDPRLLHSIGMPEPRLALVNLTAHPDLAERNNVVIAHEILHTIGANDRYRPGTGHPRFPDGYARPLQQPLYPQYKAEIMGGRVPLSASIARQPRSLEETTIGPITAAEIGWIGRQPAD